MQQHYSKSQSRELPQDGPQSQKPFPESRSVQQKRASQQESLATSTETTTSSGTTAMMNSLLPRKTEDFYSAYRALQWCIKRHLHGTACLLLDYMERLAPSRVALKKTGAGIYVQELRKHSDSTVSVAARRLIAFWRSSREQTQHQVNVVEPSEAPNTATADTPATAPNTTPLDIQDPSHQSSKQPQYEPISPRQSNVQDHNLEHKMNQQLQRQQLQHQHQQLQHQQEKQEIIMTKCQKQQQESPMEQPPSLPTSVQRTMISDKISAPSYLSDSRLKCFEMMYNSLCLDIPDLSRQLATAITAPPIVARCAQEIELALFEKHHEKCEQSYRSDLRSLYSNVKKPHNAELRMSLLLGKCMPATLVRMTPAEFASASLKQEMQVLKETNLFLAKGAGNIKAESDIFLCSRCKKRRTSYFQLQTRSADEPLTTFVECLECGHHWRM